MGRRLLAAVLGTAMLVALLFVIPAAPASAALGNVQVATGAAHTCALSPSGQAYCWGSNVNGRLGDNTIIDRLTPVTVQQGGVTFASIGVGVRHSCALTGAGQTYCWGAGANGLLGDNTNTDRLIPVAVQQSGISFTSISVGGNHTCGLSEGQAYCWGVNTNGRLGDNTATMRPTPVAVQQGAITFVSVVAGSVHTCGLTSGGAAHCWGYGGNGLLGNNSTADQYSPVTVQQGALSFTSIVAGSSHNCGLTSGGATYCWGSNASGRLGDNTTSDRLTPVAVQQGAVIFVSVTAGGSHTCGLTSGGQAHCWGDNVYGQVGDNTSTQRLTPTAVSGGVFWSVVSTSAASAHTCGVKTATQLVYCWGSRLNGRIGDNAGYSLQQTKPVAVTGDVAFTSIVTGNASTCGLTGGGQVYCWGFNANGRLGDNTATDRIAPVAVQQGAVTFASIASGQGHVCGLTSAGQAYCWGFYGNGRLGDGAATDHLIPVAVQQGATTFSSIVTGSAHTCGLTSAGQAHCWGAGANGRMGDNATTDRLTPVAVQQGAVIFASITAGSAHTCGLTSGGQAHCWGAGGNGRLGNNSTTDELTPVAVQQGVVTYSSIAAGGGHTCALTSAGQAHCWVQAQTAAWATTQQPTD